jgi:DNA recombination protein RmuC
MGDMTLAAIAVVAVLQLVVVLVVFLRGGSAAGIQSKIEAMETKLTAIEAGVGTMNRSLTDTGRRGAMGELLLKDLLANAFHGRHHIQYTFASDRATVDAALEIRDQLVPIDSKFPLTNYTLWAEAADEKTRNDAKKAFVRDVKARIDETKKYIRTNERTYPFAFMFIPTESVYYSLLTGQISADNGRTLIQHAAEQNVFIVSPATLYVYLYTVMDGLRGLEIEGEVGQIVARIKELDPQLSAFSGAYKKMGDAVKSLGRAYDNAADQWQAYELALSRATSSADKHG